MVYRPRYLDEKRRNYTRILINAQLKNGKIVMNYSDNSKGGKHNWWQMRNKQNL